MVAGVAVAAAVEAAVVGVAVMARNEEEAQHKKKNHMILV